MGLIFLAIIWLGIFAVIAVVLGSIGVAVVYPFLSKNNQKRPFWGIISLFAEPVTTLFCGACHQTVW